MALAARVYRLEEPQPKLRRIKRSNRHRVRVAGRGMRNASLAVIPLVLILVYVGLTAQLTAQTYRLHDDQALQTALVARNTELRQQVARLESLPRLEAAAAKLHMTVPPGVALLAPEQPAPQPRPQTALAASIEDVRKWFGLR
jgi:hypothetical protein